jgi:hypothetical protein
MNARAIEWLREIEASAAELVELGDLLFSRGEPSDLALCCNDTSCTSA